MSIKANVLSWVLVALLGAACIYQFIGANKAEQRAQAAEDIAKQFDAQLKDFKAESDVRLKLAEAQYQASLQESAGWRAQLARLESRPVPKVAIPGPQTPQDELSAAVKAQGSVQPPEASQTVCKPVYDQDHPDKNLIIEGFQVSLCDGKPVVQAEAAVDLFDSKALLAETQTKLAEATLRLVVEDKTLAQYKVAEQQWKKAAHKSRIKRILGVAEKVALFGAGLYLGHKF